jgi:hypothetical protein
MSTALCQKRELMKKRISKTSKTDRIILVDLKKLIECTSKTDLYCGVAKKIENLYSKYWFRQSNGEEYFIPPAVYIEDGNIKFINGRHRTLVLKNYLNELPLLVGNLDHDNFGEKATVKSKQVLNEITLKQFHEHSIFDKLPELDFGDFPEA